MNESVKTCGVRARWMIAADGLPFIRLFVLSGVQPRTKGRPRWGVRAHLATEPMD